MASYNSSLLKWMNIIFFILTVFVNSLAGSTTIIGNRNTAQISDANPTLITPAGYVFSIWGIIYLLLGVFVVYQALSIEGNKKFQKEIGYLFVLSCLCNIVWLFLWQFNYLSLSIVLMFLLLASLIFIYLRLNIGRPKVSLREKIAFHLPFSVYLGWITIASIANVAVTLVSMNWEGFGISPQTWAYLIIIIALSITLLMLAIRLDIAYGLVIIWALVGIASKQSGNQDIVMITEISAIAVAVTIIVAILIAKVKHKL